MTIRKSRKEQTTIYKTYI